MITMLYGYPGGGKSYYAVSEFIVSAMRKGMPVYSSLAGFNPFIAATIHGVDATLYHQISPEDFTPWVGVEQSSLFVFDEVQNLYGSSNHKEHANERELLKKFLSMHRHSGHAVVAICQEPSTVDKFFRDLTEHFVELRKMNMVFGQNTNTFSAIHRKGGTGKSNKPIKQETKKYLDIYTILYQSTIPGTDEAKTKSDTVRVNPLKILGPALLTLLVFCGGLGTFLYQRHQKNKTAEIKQMVAMNDTRRPKVVASADGWIADSLCVRWLSGSVEVAKSCPDLGERSGDLLCRVSSGDSCRVTVRAGELYGPPDRFPGSEMEPQGPRSSRRDSASSGSSVSPRSGG